MRILVVESDPYLRTTLKTNLEAHSFTVDIAEDGERGLFLARMNTYEIILLGYTVPVFGLTICQEMRKSKKDQYIIVLSVDTQITTKVEVLNGGADDCLEQAYIFEELLARIHAFKRRISLADTQALSYRDLSMNSQSRTVLRGVKEIKLTRKEFSLLEQLLQSRGEVVSRATLIERVWGAQIEACSNTIESHVVSLRRKIDRKNRLSIIQTVSGKGYKIG